jgi:hypothetical protein
MPVDKIRFEKLIPTVQYGNELFVMEATIAPGETIEQLYDEMYKTAVRQFERNNPHLAGQSEQFQPHEPAILPIAQVEKPIGKSMVEQIMSCDSMKVLESYKLLVKNNDEWKAAYDSKYNQLKAIEIKLILDRTDAITPSQIQSLCKISKPF